MLEYIQNHISTGIISRVHLARKFPKQINEINELIRQGILIKHPEGNPTGECYTLNEKYHA